MKPEIFNHRVRIDKDPTIFFPQYLQVARKLSVAKASDTQHSTVSAVATTQDVHAVYEDIVNRISGLEIKVQQGANSRLLHHLRDFERVLQRFELDALVAVTCQGRSKPSRISYKRPGSAPNKNKRPTVHQSDSRKSSVGQHLAKGGSNVIIITTTATSPPPPSPPPTHHHHHYHHHLGVQPRPPTHLFIFLFQADEPIARVVAEVPSSAGSARAKPPGVSKGDDDDWHCQICNRGVKNVSQSVTQHCNGETHVKKVNTWGDKALAPYLCRFNHFFVS